jgi:hypothetical protein
MSNDDEPTRPLLDSRLARLAPIVVAGPLSTPCLVATRCLHPNGYARTRVAGRGLLAHRFAFELAHGPIPHGLMVLHECDNRPCINVEHLHLGDANVNAHERARRGRSRLSRVVTVGERNGMSKLSDRRVRFIRRCSACSTRDLARRYGVSTNTISSARRRLSWRHLP